jgi:hypothetical protein
VEACRLAKVQLAKNRVYTNYASVTPNGVASLTAKPLTLPSPEGTQE